MTLTLRAWLEPKPRVRQVNEPPRCPGKGYFRTFYWSRTYLQKIEYIYTKCAAEWVLTRWTHIHVQLPSENRTPLSPKSFPCPPPRNHTPRRSRSPQGVLLSSVIFTGFVIRSRGSNPGEVTGLLARRGPGEPVFWYGGRVQGVRENWRV